MWFVVREWLDGGASGLLDYGYAVTWADLEEVASKYDVTRVLVDVGYAQRAMEVYEYCLEYNAWPTKGVNEKSMPYRKLVIDPFEGKRGAGVEDIVQYNFNTDTFKRILMTLMRGEAKQKWFVYDKPEREYWFVYDKPEREYVRQVVAEQLVDGEWKLRAGHPDNHLFDCEVLQLLAATIDGAFRSE
jgi:hypothetical protein